MGRDSAAPAWARGDKVYGAAVMLFLCTIICTRMSSYTRSIKPSTARSSGGRRQHALAGPTCVEHASRSLPDFRANVQQCAATRCFKSITIHPAAHSRHPWAHWGAWAGTEGERGQSCAATVPVLLMVANVCVFLLQCTMLACDRRELECVHGMGSVRRCQRGRRARMMWILW